MGRLLVLRGGGYTKGKGTVKDASLKKCCIYPLMRYQELTNLKDDVNEFCVLMPSLAHIQGASGDGCARKVGHDEHNLVSVSEALAS